VLKLPGSAPILVGLALLACAAAATEARGATIAHWRFEGDLTDSGPHTSPLGPSYDYDLRTVPAPAYGGSYSGATLYESDVAAAAPGSQSMAFGGAYGLFENTKLLSGERHFTIEAFVKLDAQAFTAQRSVIYSEGEPELYFAGPASTLHFSAAAGTDLVVAVTLAADTWYHIAATFDQTATGGVLALFLNGTSLGSMPTVYTASSGANGNGSHLGGFYGYRFYGSLDEVRLSDVALTPTGFLGSTPVPEPASLALLSLGGSALVTARLRSRR